MESIDSNKERILDMGEFLLINKGEVNIPLLEYKKDEWWITGELDIEGNKRAKSLGFPRIYMLSMAISHNEFLVFNWGTRALVHNTLLSTINFYGASPTTKSWPQDLSNLCLKIEKEINFSKLQSFNSKLIEINNKMNEVKHINNLLSQ